jgi:hypothetical protein
MFVLVFVFVQTSVSLSISCLRRTKALEDPSASSPAAASTIRVELDRAHNVHFAVPNIVEKKKSAAEAVEGAGK